MMTFIFGFLKPKNRKSKAFAKDRLKQTIAYDKSGFSDAFLSQLKHDILSVLGRYVDIGKEGVNLSIASGQHDRMTYITTSIPVRKVKNE